MKTIKKEIKWEWDPLSTTSSLEDLELPISVENALKNWSCLKNLMLSIFLFQQFPTANIINPLLHYRIACENFKKSMSWKAVAAGTVIDAIPNKQLIEKWEFTQLIKF